MMTFQACLRAAIASLALASVASPLPAATGGTRYFVNVPESQVPLAIAAFSSDARADVAAFSYGSSGDARPARGKFSIRLAGSPFTAGQTIASMVVLAQTPAKVVTFTFTNVTIDAADQTGSTSERVTFEAANYSVKFSTDSTDSGHTATQ